MKKIYIFPALLFSAVVLLGPAETRADIYRYTDENGVIHLTNVPTDNKFKLWLKENKRVAAMPGRRSGKGSGDYSGFDDLIVKAADLHNVDCALVKAIIKAESGFNHTAVSRKGAMGLMQLMPGTANNYQVDDSFDPWSNIEGGVRHLKYLLGQYNGDLPLTLAAYNAGEGAVQKYNYRIPPYEETQSYVKRVMHYLKKYSSDSQKFARSEN